MESHEQLLQIFSYLDVFFPYN